MLRKKQILTQTNNLIESKESSQQILQKRNKVTVQYMQEQQQLIQKPEKSSATSNVRTQDDVEVENVEYLEENPTTDDLIDKPSTERQKFEDTFYPNAIHCLLDLYKDKYVSLLTMGEGGDLNVVEVWKDIAKDMQESYFEFNEQQVRQKYILLKEQYFGLHFKEDIENFDYFEQLHNIYKDPGKENLIKGLVVDENSSTYYKDEILLNHVQLETNNGHLQDFRSEAIVHKEHEFIDMVEKELQAMDDGVQVAESNKDNDQQANKIVQQSTVKVENLENQTDFKGNNTDEETTLEGPPLKTRKIDESWGNIKIPHTSLKEPTSTENKDITLCQYNEHQERRHREKMNILEKSLKLQENAIEQHKLLLQELIKRLPS